MAGPPLVVCLDGVWLETPKLSSDLVREVCQWLGEDGLFGVEEIIADVRQRIALQQPVGQRMR